MTRTIDIIGPDVAATLAALLRERILETSKDEVDRLDARH